MHMGRWKGEHVLYERVSVESHTAQRWTIWRYDVIRVRSSRTGVLAHVVSLWCREVPSAHALLVSVTVRGRIWAAWMAGRVHSGVLWEREYRLAGMVGMGMHGRLFVLEHLVWRGAGAAYSAIASLDGFT